MLDLSSMISDNIVQEKCLISIFKQNYFFGKCDPEVFPFCMIYKDNHSPPVEHTNPPKIVILFATAKSTNHRSEHVQDQSMSYILTSLRDSRPDQSPEGIVVNGLSLKSI